MKITIEAQGTKKILHAETGTSLLTLLQEHAITLSAPCGGNGTCGKCQVQVTDASGIRSVLACRYTPVDGDRISVDAEAQPVYLDTVGAFSSIAPDSTAEGYGIACDLGTTTVACQLVRLSDGAVVRVTGAGNAQRIYGSDVIARITAAEAHGTGLLQETIVRQLHSMILQLCAAAGISTDALLCMTVAGNPTMCHLLAGLDPSGIGRAPFLPVSYFGSEVDAAAIGLPIAGKLYLLPSVSGYVGGDITADLLSVGADTAELPILLIDVGTNGEMVLGNRERLLCCSTAAGPAFEGAEITCGMTAAPGAISEVEYAGGKLRCGVIGGVPARGICGSGLIDAAAVMLELGVLEATGRLLDPEEDTEDIPPEAAAMLFLTPAEEPAFRLTESVYITQADIRRLQLGKGAIAAGARVLLHTWEKEHAQACRLLLAGGFGSYIRPESAARIGMIPEELLSVTRAVGNTALEGARAALISTAARDRLSAIQQRMEYLELSGNPLFNEYYMEAMLFPADAEF